MLPQYHSLLAEDGFHCADAATGRPRPSLRPYVAGYAGFRADGDGYARRRLLPLTVTTLIVDLDSAHALVTGPRIAPAVYERAVWRHGVAVGLTPAGVSALLGLPASELVGRSIPFSAAGGAGADELIGRLGEVPDWPGRFALLEDQLTRWLQPGKATDGWLMHAWWRLQDPTSWTSIGGLAAELGVSPRGLQLAFQRHIGMSPKSVARIARFQRAVHMLSGQDAGFARAVEYGYADQSHFNREVRAMSGLTPAELFAFVQDSADARR
ncbi:AraC family transcriptional regulator [Phytoactinopolyspora halotolerans]|uniref:Helix-turn-helix transcriptional regulator n=1 Tax=Phytoactinopolyspora halotolerans TaxID=1981512 RepID=A0A6L9SHR1_9ACTN|nr:helix-turn-helix domain-containing protein [Phytoactinopolyspora halotolerans]NEE04673.1 helix-turn-helix transcriptional regulator [Phytoactinopolyspora halotolerans]